MFDKIIQLVVEVVLLFLTINKQNFKFHKAQQNFTGLKDISSKKY